MSDLLEEGPALGDSAGLNKALLVTSDKSDIKQKTEVPQALIELLFDDIGDNTGALISTLNAALAMRDAGDSVGLIYGLRRARCYWKSISASAAELVAADADRLSALRQEGEAGR
jgi:hypothetical protein